VQLPPITLGGYLPNDVLNEDLITTVSASMGWTVRAKKSYFSVNASGNYTSRIKYSQISALGGDVSTGASRTMGRWVASAFFSSFVSNSDQFAFQPSQSEKVGAVDASADEVGKALNSARSPNPDLAAAAQFVPINQSFVTSDVYGNQVMGTATSGTLAYRTSSRSEISGTAFYSKLSRIGASGEPGFAPDFASPTVQGMAIGLRHSLTRRHDIGVSINYSRSAGLFDDAATYSSFSHEWSTHRWFTSESFGIGVRNNATLSPDGVASGTRPDMNYAFTAGFKSRSNTFLAGYSRSFHDDYGYGGYNPHTGIKDAILTTRAGWYWAPPRGAWIAQANFSASRAPGNFSYIHGWEGTAFFGRQLGRQWNVRGEFEFNRHGSRGFEGFAMTRETYRVNFVWSPMKRLL
jgi:hypothetical protein